VKRRQSIRKKCIRARIEADYSLTVAENANSPIVAGIKNTNHDTPNAIQNSSHSYH
jgi:hypothetical protein